MRWTALVLGLAIEGCTAPSTLPGHNHPEGVVVPEATAEGDPAAIWSLTVSGAT